jgi:hypothetical protein
MDAETSTETLAPVYETKRRLTLPAYIRKTENLMISRGFTHSLQTNAGYYLLLRHNRPPRGLVVRVPGY